MQIGGLYINIIFYPHKPLNFVIFLQSESIDFNIVGLINPIDSPQKIRKGYQKIIFSSILKNTFKPQQIQRAKLRTSRIFAETLKAFKP